MRGRTSLLAASLVAGLSSVFRLDRLGDIGGGVVSMPPERPSFGFSRTRCRIPHSNGKPCYPRSIGGHNLNTDNGAQLKAHFDSKNATAERLQAHRAHLEKMKARKQVRANKSVISHAMAVSLAGA